MARVAAPVVVINLAMQAMGVVDTLMVGRLGGEAIAAVALGNFYFHNVAIFGIGVLFALDPIIAQAVGAGDQPAIARGVQRGLVVAVAIGLLVMLALVPGEWVLGGLDQPPEVVRETAVYARRRLIGVVPFLLFHVLRQSLQAIGHVRPVIVSVLVANVVNTLANWMLVYGAWGAPRLGVAGSGVATALAMWSMTVFLAVLAWPVLRSTLRPWRPESLTPGPLLRMTRLGVPIGTQWFFESFAFGLTAIFMGWMGTTSLAAHEIALNMAAFTFMVPLGISGAAAAVVGRAIGRGDLPAARRDAAAAIACGTGVMAVSAAVFIGAPNWLVAWYTTEAPTAMLAASLLPLAGWFQVVDGLQAVTSGVLRGTGDTRVPAFLHMVAFWGVGIPLGWWLGFHTTWRERGLWMGLVAGLAVAGCLQSGRVWFRLRGPVGRVVIDRS
jgi:MATE family multidrug resistance protein